MLDNFPDFTFSKNNFFPIDYY